ncbi:hypothetical protein [Nocardia sp. SSK8]|uniref:hypothetical protein n=1 Tax=Nocardia sp. SSK8 TaxID=3120154 RepID=UPI00300B450F
MVTKLCVGVVAAVGFAVLAVHSGGGSPACPTSVACAAESGPAQAVREAPPQTKTPPRTKVPSGPDKPRMSGSPTTTSHYQPSATKRTPHPSR